MSTDDEFDKPRKKYVMRTEEKFARANQKRGGEDPAGANDVYQWREDQRTLEQQAGVDEVGAPPKYRYRRQRDFWTVLLLINGGFGGMMYLNQNNPFWLIFGLTGIIMGNLSVYWLLYHVLRKY